MKGWELRIWEKEGMPHFSLLPRDDHPKTDDEITNAAVKGFSAIKARLDQLKPGEMVIISGTPWVDSQTGIRADLVGAYVNLVRTYCEKIGLKVE